MSSLCYLDHNATTPLDPRVLEAMLPYLQQAYANPSSVYRAGRYARAAIDRAREQVAALVDAHPSQVIFTSGGTEANNLAIKGVCAAFGGGRLAVSAVEHASIMGPAQAMTAAGWELTQLPVDAHGRVADGAVSEGLKAGPIALFSVMCANNETGVLQPVAEIAAQARASGALTHSDLTQAVGKMDVSFPRLNIHLATLSAHKIYGPKGIGALIYDKAVDLLPLIQGGGQERELRAGTENVAAIVGFGQAAALAKEEWAHRAAHAAVLRDALEQQLATLAGVVIFGQGAARLPNTSYIGVPGIDGETLLMQFDRAHIAVSSGSACDSGTTEPSHVLVAMGVAQEIGRSAVRTSFGQQNTLDDVTRFVSALRDIQSRLSA